jgi:AmmeMemoRadiSam system protein B
MFYPDDPKTLREEIEGRLARAEAQPGQGIIKGLILPHAGYHFSGDAASAGYKLLAGKTFECVVIVSPSHREYFDGISVYEGSGYRTPLGDLNVDEDARARMLEGDPVIEASLRGHRGEHAIEVQLPFIQNVLGEVNILPIVMGEQRREYCYHLARRLAEVFAGRQTLLIASTDLSHYHAYEDAERLDGILVDEVAGFNDEQIMTDLENRRTEACGGGPMVAVMAAARRLGANRAGILCHCNSGDVTGDRSSVVGYLSAVLFSAN